MTCQHFEEYLSSYLDNELEENEWKEIEKHLSTCIHCRGRMEEEKRTKSLLEKKVPWAKAPHAMRERILAEMESGSGGFMQGVLSFFKLKPFPATATVTATLGVIVVLGVLFYLRSEPPLQAAPTRSRAA